MLFLWAYALLDARDAGQMLQRGRRADGAQQHTPPTCHGIDACPRAYGPVQRAPVPVAARVFQYSPKVLFASRNMGVPAVGRASA